jgi:NADH oxidase (H2O2-forming)
MMKKYDAIIIGGSAAGIPAAVTVRRYYPGKSILIIRKGKSTPIPCGIPYIFGTVNSVDKNLIPDQVLENNKIDHVIAEIKEVDPKAKTLTANGDVYEYDKLVLATGSEPVIPPIEGVDLDNIFPIHKDTEYLSSVLGKINSSRNIVVVGGGFIGVEFAEECKKGRDVNVTLVELMPNCLTAAFDDEFCQEASRILENEKINLLYERKVEQFVGEGSVQEVVLDDGQRLPADAVILGIGAKPNADLARQMGIELGRGGGIRVDVNMRTSIADVFACGDCVEARSFFADMPSPIKLASTATTQARIAGANLFSIKRADRGIIGVFSTALSGHAFACAGLTERAAVKDGYDVSIGVAEGPNRHPGGMPGMQNMRVKLIFNKHDKTILGGQIFGAYNAGEMINAISAFITSKFTADDIALFQLGTHPALTASPIAYQLVNAAEIANMKMV